VLGKEAEDLLSFKAKVSQDMLHLPGPDFVDRIFAASDRNPQVLRSLQQLYSAGRLANTGYLSILPSRPRN
jgi:class I fructose-bisphosphate aldolase